MAAGGITSGPEARRLAIRATKFVAHDALAEMLADELATALEYQALAAAMNDEALGPSDIALEIVDKIEAASQPI